jgi:hypothetical protein
MPILDDSLKTYAQVLLNERALALPTVEFGQQNQIAFSLKQIRNGTPEAMIAEWLSPENWPYSKKQPAIYVISANDADCAKDLANAFPDKKNRDFAGPRVNKDNKGEKTLYVGSSENVAKRLTEHLWCAKHKNTYALNLGLWCPNGEGSIHVHVQPILKCNSREVRQDLEDALWQQLKPIFGKRGGR